jgi:hypothetical protein
MQQMEVDVSQYATNGSRWESMCSEMCSKWESNKYKGGFEKVEYLGKNARVLVCERMGINKWVLM